MSFEAVIFDFNGVLVWDSDLHEEAWSQLAQAVRGAPFTQAEMRVHLHGRPSRDILAYLAGRRLGEADAAAQIARKDAIYRGLCRERGAEYRLSPGAAELLDWVAARRIPRAIATSSGPDDVAFFVAHFGLARWFAPAQIIFDDGTIRGKPAPDIYLRAAERLGAEPRQCVVIEDARAGLAAAHAAGVGALIALGPAEEHGSLRQLPGVGAAISSLERFPRELLGGE
jgi:HAD superfamily hydrolase (TIGR01509 family)